MSEQEKAVEKLIAHVVKEFDRGIIDLKLGDWLKRREVSLIFDINSTNCTVRKKS